MLADHSLGAIPRKIRSPSEVWKPTGQKWFTSVGHPKMETLRARIEFPLGEQCAFNYAATCQGGRANGSSSMFRSCYAKYSSVESTNYPVLLEVISLLWLVLKGSMSARGRSLYQAQEVLRESSDFDNGTCCRHGPDVFLHRAQRLCDGDVFTPKTDPSFTPVHAQSPDELRGHEKKKPDLTHVWLPPRVFGCLSHAAFTTTNDSVKTSLEKVATTTLICVAADSTIMEDNPFAPIDNHPFINVFGQEPSSEASSSRDLTDWKDDTDDESNDQELEAHYMYMAQVQEVAPDPVDNSGLIFDDEPMHKLVEIVLFIVDSGCSKHMIRNLKLLTNFVEKFLGTVKFGNDQIAPILGYGDLVQGTITIKRVFYVEGLNHNLFSIGQFCDADSEVAFRKSTCYIRDLKGNDLLTGSCGTDLYSISLQDSTIPNPICLMAKATSSQAWLWHRRLSHLNFDTINLLSKNNIVNGLPKLKFVKDHLCSSCELGKAKRKSFHTKTTPSSKRQLQLLHMDLCGPMRGIRHETLTAQTPEQNGIVKRRNRTLVEATRTLLSAAKVPLFFWAEAIATACFTQNRSLVIPRHEKTPYHIINARKPSVKFFHIFGSLCYIVRDGENLDKMKEKGDACIFVGYSTQSKAYRVFNKRTRMIVETIHVNFDELPQMASDHVSSDPGPQCSTTVLEQDSLSPGPQSQENVPQVAETVTTSNELELLYSPMFSELLNGTSHVVSKSSAVHAADNPDKRQQHNTTHTSTTTDVADPPPLNIHSTHQTPTQVPTVTAPENIIQAETNTENAQFDDDEFINIFSTPVQEQGETSSRHVDSSNMHTFYQHHPSAQRYGQNESFH
ncbi:integrase, catalytic region, zinc finger, CCHC-type containing protein [Tanacetum coccineum]|uniref:Integrase, catalytic region, zinc finger, CCHC-type containing protein n=1 Tax=Tanacetum coccineum TaxID=301880 RepID=A0ABQ5GQU1_9ASTR